MLSDHSDWRCYFRKQVCNCRNNGEWQKQTKHWSHACHFNNNVCVQTVNSEMHMAVSDVECNSTSIPHFYSPDLAPTHDLSAWFQLQCQAGWAHTEVTTTPLWHLLLFLFSNKLTSALNFDCEAVAHIFLLVWNTWNLMIFFLTSSLSDSTNISKGRKKHIFKTLQLWLRPAISWW